MRYPLPSNTASERQYGAKQPTTRGTLLIVDDDKGARQSLRVLFKDDYSVLVAEDGHRALQRARDSDVDVAIVDIIMPEISGTELLDQLKQLDDRIEVIMLTAYETVDTARQAIRLGACDYLRKPFDLWTVKESVTRAMERRRLSEEVRANSLHLQQLNDRVHQYKLEEERVRTEGQIYAGIIHDLNNPLTAISGYIDLVTRQLQQLDRLEGEDLEKVRAKLVRVRKQAEICSGLSQRYVDFTRKAQEGVARVAINQVLGDLELLLRNHPSRSSHQVNFIPLDEDVEARINGADLIQILLNLTVNALQSTETRHRVDVGAARQEMPVEMYHGSSQRGVKWIVSDDFCADAAGVLLWVADDGPGIPETIMDQIFDSYFTTKGVGEGSGLGLAIVQRLVRSSGAALKVSSVVDQGTTFELYLPARADSDAADPSDQ